MDQIEQDFARFKKPAMAIAGGIAAALVIATLPHVYLEDIVGATGLSEIVPAAAPPLGNTARGLIAVVAGMISASALYLFLNYKTNSHDGASDMGLAIRKNMTSTAIDGKREGKASLAVPKLNLSVKSLTKFLKKPKRSPGQVTELKDLPDTRAADRHPDAPARQPIFASSDLGLPLAEKIKHFDEPLFEQKPADTSEPAVQYAAPVEPEVPEARLHPPMREQVAEDQGASSKPQSEAMTPQADLSGLSLAELADRLEAGLARLEALQKRERVSPSPATPSVPDPVSTHPVPETPSAPAPVAIPPLRSVDKAESDSPQNRQADMDAALKAALGTLEKMTVQR